MYHGREQTVEVCAILKEAGSETETGRGRVLLTPAWPCTNDLISFLCSFMKAPQLSDGSMGCRRGLQNMAFGRHSNYNS